MTVDLFPGPVLPVEDRHRGVVHTEAVRVDLQVAAKEAGLRTVEFEEAGYSLLGPLALNIAAPDGGSMHLLEAVATPEQKERCLRPLATGEIRSCFAMTEPAPSAGSDPAALTTRAERVPGGRRIDGRKWFITGADGAGENLFGGRQSSSSPARPRRTSPAPPSPSTAECPVTVR